MEVIYGKAEYEGKVRANLQGPTDGLAPQYLVGIGLSSQLS